MLPGVFVRRCADVSLNGGMTKTPVLVALGSILLGGCTAADPPEPAAVTSEALSKACAAYPLTLVADLGAEARVRGAFEALSPGASVTFARDRGTISMASNLSISLGICPRGRSVEDRVRALVGASPEAFRIDPKEWVATFAPTCDQVSDSGTLVTWTRTALAGASVKKDAFAYSVRMKGSMLVMTFASGTYLPPASDALRADLARCAPFDVAAAEASLRRSTLPFQTFQYCIPTGDDEYTPEARDAVAFGDDFWEWDEPLGTAGDRVVLRRTRAATLEVAEANWTKPLLASNANCAWGGVNHVGFTLRLDSVASSLTESAPGVGCVVCVH